MPDGWNDWKECDKCAEFIAVLTPLLYYKVGQGGARCQGKWLKSCVRILWEIENGNAVFTKWKTKKWVKKLRKGIFRVGVWHVLRLGRPSFELRSGMFCTSVRHLSQCLKWNTELWKLRKACKALIVNKLRKCAKNRVFRPKHFVVEKKCVDWCIGCCVFWRTNPSGAPCVTTSTVGARDVAKYEKRCSFSRAISPVFPCRVPYLADLRLTELSRWAALADVAHFS